MKSWENILNNYFKLKIKIKKVLTNMCLVDIMIPVVRWLFEPLAQLAEHLTFNQRVRSSSLRWLTKAVCLFDRPLFLFFLPWHTLLNRFFSSKPRFWPVKRFWKPRSYGLFDFVYNFFICADEAKTALFLHKMSQNKLFPEQPIFDAFEKSYNIQLNDLLHEVNIVRS